MVIITMGGYPYIFPHIINIYFLVAAVSECYQMFTPSSTYVHLIGYSDLATAAA